MIPKTILVTGGAGFIGSHLCDRLLALGYKVICVDNFNDSYPPVFKRQNIASARKHPEFVLYETDICDKEKLEKVFIENSIDKVVHLAARGGVQKSIEEPEKYFETNVLGTLNVLELMTKYQIPHLLFSSSSTVYGRDAKTPFSESDPPQKPTSPYGASKIAAEAIIYTYSYLHKINATILRFFNVYGPRTRPDMALYKFTELLSHGRPVTENKGHRRDFTYIDDIIDGVVSSLDKEFAFEIINLGRSHPIGVHTYILNIAKALNVTPKISFRSPPPEEMMLTMADTRKARNLLRFRPKTKVEDGIKSFVSWYNQERRISSKRGAV